MNVDTLSRENLRQVSRLHRQQDPGMVDRSLVAALTDPGPLGGAWASSPSFFVWSTGPRNRPTGAGSAIALGSLHFDVTRNRPAAPGSWLYGAAGHAIHVVSGLSPVHGLVLLAAAGLGRGRRSQLCGGHGARGTLGRSGRRRPWWPRPRCRGSPVPSSPPPASTPCSVPSSSSWLGRARPDRAHGVVAVFALGLGRRRPTLSRCFLFPPGRHRRGGRASERRPAPGSDRRRRRIGGRLVRPHHRDPAGGSRRLGPRRASAVGPDLGHASSVFAASSSHIVTNVGTFGGWSVVTLAPLLVVAAVALLVLAGARVITGQRGGNAGPAHLECRPPSNGRWSALPRYQSPGAILGAALVPPVAVLTLGSVQRWGCRPRLSRPRHRASPAYRWPGSCITTAAASGTPPPWWPPLLLAGTMALEHPEIRGRPGHPAAERGPSLSEPLALEDPLPSRPTPPPPPPSGPPTAVSRALGRGGRGNRSAQAGRAQLHP